METPSFTNTAIRLNNKGCGVDSTTIVRTELCTRSVGCCRSSRNWPVTRDVQAEEQTEAFCGLHMKDKSTTNLFVYGTLMPGEFNHRQIQGFVHGVRPGSIEGVLVNMGEFPALVPGKGIVKGVILYVDEAALEITDRIEGYSSDRQDCLYIRKEVVVRLDDGKDLPAWTYEFGAPSRVADPPLLVVGQANGEPIFRWGDRLRERSISSSLPKIRPWRRQES